MAWKRVREYALKKGQEYEPGVLKNDGKGSESNGCDLRQARIFASEIIGKEGRGWRDGLP